MTGCEQEDVMDEPCGATVEYRVRPIFNDGDDYGPSVLVCGEGEHVFQVIARATCYGGSVEVEPYRVAVNSAAVGEDQP